mgnify:CR=1 FL=1
MPVDVQVRRVVQSGVRSFVKNNFVFIMPISQFDRTRIVALMQGGHAQAEVAQIVGVTQSAVSKTWKRFNDNNDVFDRRRKGCP